MIFRPLRPGPMAIRLAEVTEAAVEDHCDECRGWWVVYALRSMVGTGHMEFDTEEEAVAAFEAINASFKSPTDAEVDALKRELEEDFRQKREKWLKNIYALARNMGAIHDVPPETLVGAAVRALKEWAYQAEKEERNG